jgi:ribonuclease-3
MPTGAGELADRLGLTFDDPALLEEALVHSSFVNEQAEGTFRSNERLEFLGDAVLSLVVSDELYRRHRDEPEGILTTRRAAIVSSRGLARVARRLRIGDAIVLGQGAEHSGERLRTSVLAALFEAIVAAIYLDQGFSAARRFILEATAIELEAAVPADALKAPKSRLQEHAFALTGRPPTYHIIRAEGPDHDRDFVVEVTLEGQVLGAGEGHSRREAETMAAEAAMESIDAEAHAASAADAADAPGAEATLARSVVRRP